MHVLLRIDPCLLPLSHEAGVLDNGWCQWVMVAFESDRFLLLKSVFLVFSVHVYDIHPSFTR